MTGPLKCASGISTSDAGPDSFAEAASRAALGLGGARRTHRGHLNVFDWHV
mgnify:CR=1 FL=1